MKKFLVLFFSFLFVALAACDTTDTVQYTIYLETQNSNNYSDASNTKETVYPKTDGVNIKTANLDFYNNKLSVESSTAPKNINASIGGVTIEAELVDTWGKPFPASQNKQLASIGGTNVYNSNNKLFLEIREQTNEVLQYFNHNISWSAQGDFTKEQGKEKAVQLLIELYGEQVTNKYDIISCEYMNEQFGNFVSIRFARFLGGCRTEDRIGVLYNLSGELVCINAAKFGYATAYESAITEDMVSRAEQVLRMHFDIDPNDDIFFIDFASDGIPYLCFYRKIGEAALERVSINIF